MSGSFPAKVWKHFSGTDCSHHVEKKGNLSYLSWANAWTYVMDAFPDSSFEFADVIYLEDGTVEVWTEVTIAEGEHSLTRKCPLPVMDNRNNAIAHPTSRQISDARMRCLVKNIALFGLGLYLYRGEDLPRPPDSEPEANGKAKEAEAATITAQQAASLRDELAAVDGDEVKFCKHLKINSLEDMPATALETAKGLINVKRRAAA